VPVFGITILSDTSRHLITGCIYFDKVESFVLTK